MQSPWVLVLGLALVTSPAMAQPPAGFSPPLTAPSGPPSPQSAGAPVPPGYQTPVSPRSTPPRNPQYPVQQYQRPPARQYQAPPNQPYAPPPSRQYPAAPNQPYAPPRRPFPNQPPGPATVAAPYGYQPNAAMRSPSVPVRPPQQQIYAGPPRRPAPAPCSCPPAGARKPSAPPKQSSFLGRILHWDEDPDRPKTQKEIDWEYKFRNNG